MKISINILNYNTFEKSRNCIESCLKQQGVKYEILLIDNCSTDGSLKKLKEYFGNKIKYLKNDENYGYAKGNNIGIAYCNKQGINYSLILNSDITLNGDSLLLKLTKTLQSIPDCAVVAPMIYNVTTKGLVLNQNDSSYLKLLRRFGIIPQNKRISNKLVTISEAQGSALMVDNKEFLAVGGFPEYYFMYGEEGCFAKNILWKGKKIVWMKDEQDYALHHHDKSGSIDAWRLYLMGRNRAFEYLENKNNHGTIKWTIAFLLFLLKYGINNKKDAYVMGVLNAKKMYKNNASIIDIYQDGVSSRNEWSC